MKISFLSPSGIVLSVYVVGDASNKTRPIEVGQIGPKNLPCLIVDNICMGIFHPKDQRWNVPTGAQDVIGLICFDRFTIEV